MIVGYMRASPESDKYFCDRESIRLKFLLSDLLMNLIKWENGFCTRRVKREIKTKQIELKKLLEHNSRLTDETSKTLEMEYKHAIRLIEIVHPCLEGLPHESCPMSLQNVLNNDPTNISRTKIFFKTIRRLVKSFRLAISRIELRIVTLSYCINMGLVFIICLFSEPFLNISYECLLTQFFKVTVLYSFPMLYLTIKRFSEKKKKTM